jgi:hypothetical protein
LDCRRVVGLEIVIIHISVGAPACGRPSKINTDVNSRRATTGGRPLYLKKMI